MDVTFFFSFLFLFLKFVVGFFFFFFPLFYLRKESGLLVTTPPLLCFLSLVSSFLSLFILFTTRVTYSFIYHHVRFWLLQAFHILKYRKHGSD